ncbi:tetratricopeptide repeat protein [Halarcobacter mediterraneus]|uniref:Tetratricopeptide repeat protein n=1 Tax=Halarcobacter mediterraneus TaxID=2023153 RepID=A0A4Q1AT56_9BACT|nr:tetratricopeptide repeat protein [Halarcobacter mediterraneus]RXK13042.1 tetratricopeptide repeat protein [Halarcobacter mediterraneus]
MDSLVLEYRDPLFGIIIFFILIFTISFITYSFSLYKEKIARKDYRKLLKRFEIGKLKEEDYVHLYKTYNLPFDSIILLASSFVHKGDYNKAISVYLTLLEHVTDRVKKEELLELLGTTYFKGGFMQRAKEIFIKILKFSPRNTQALKYLLIVNEKLKDYKSANEIIDCLDEIGEDIQKDKLFIETLSIINNPIESFELKSKKLDVILKNNPSIQRLIAKYYIENNKKHFWDIIDYFDLKKLIDLLWYLDYKDINLKKVSKNVFLNELYTAKGYLNTAKHSDDFVFDILIALNNHEHKIPATVDFEFICSSCKHVHPIFDNRCPNCHSILTFDIKYHLTKDLIERNQSLQ